MSVLFPTISKKNKLKTLKQGGNMCYIAKNQSFEKLYIVRSIYNGVFIEKGKRIKGEIKDINIWKKLLDLCRKDYEKTGIVSDNTVGKNGEMLNIKEVGDNNDLVLEYFNNKTNKEWVIKMQYVTWFYIVIKNTTYTNKKQKTKKQLKPGRTYSPVVTDDLRTPSDIRSDNRSDNRSHHGLRLDISAGFE